MTKFNEGDDDIHFANFLEAVRSRKLTDLNADIEEGHLSSALCHLGNISYRLGAPQSADELDKTLATLQDDRQRQGHAGADARAPQGQRRRYGGDQAARSARSLPFDPKTETFPGNDEANAMLTREYRKPFVVPPAGQV